MPPAGVRAAATLLAAVAAVLVGLCGAALPDEQHGGGVIGVRKLATAVDCSGAVAFSGAGLRAVLPGGQISYRRALNDRGVGWSLETGEFTCHCPGLYQLSFAGYGEKPDTRVMLKKRDANTTEWRDVVSAGGPHAGGGAGSALLDLEVGDRTAVWMAEGALLQDGTSTTFSGYRIIKK